MRIVALVVVMSALLGLAGCVEPDPPEVIAEAMIDKTLYYNRDDDEYSWEGDPIFSYRFHRSDGIVTLWERRGSYGTQWETFTGYGRWYARPGKVCHEFEGEFGNRCFHISVDDDGNPDAPTGWDVRARDVGSTQRRAGLNPVGYEPVTLSDLVDVLTPVGEALESSGVGDYIRSDAAQEASRDASAREASCRRNTYEPCLRACRELEDPNPFDLGNPARSSCERTCDSQFRECRNN